MFSTMLGVAVLLSGWSDAPVGWHNDYAAALAEARASDKPLFIVICPGASEYAEFASLGEFVSDKVERTLKSDYVRFIIDTDTPDGRELAQKFDAGSDPHFVILDRTAKWQVFYKTGYLDASQLETTLTKYRRIKMSSTGRPISDFTQARREVVQLCST